MTILNVLVRPAGALVAVDTLASYPDGQVRRVSKLSVVPHCFSVVATRGLAVFRDFAVMMANDRGGDFDDLLARVRSPDLAKAAAKATAGMLSASGVPGAATLNELVLVGYSPRSGRIVGHYMRLEEDGKTFHEEPITQNAFSPAPASVSDFPDVETPQDLMRLAPEQARIVRAAGYAAGGELIVAEVRRGEVRVFKAGGFPAADKE